MHGDDHESIDKLLPWFVNRTLAPGEHHRVRRHVDGCEGCREAVSLLSAVASTLRHATATPLVPPARPDRLLEAIDRSGKGTRRRRTPATEALAASLAAAIVAAALLLPDRQQTETSRAPYETATSTGRAAAMDYVLELQFVQGTPRAGRERVLHGLEARNASEAADGGYRITVRLSAASLEELEDYVRAVESLPEVESAAVVALQLPVTRRQ